jgi:peptidylprolyl isomerase
LGAAVGLPGPWGVGLAGDAVGAGVAPGDATVRVTPRPVAPPPGPPARPRSRPKKRTRAWILVAVPVAFAATAGGIVLGTSNGGGNEPVAGGHNPTVIQSSRGGGGSPSQLTSPPAVGDPGPTRSTASTTGAEHRNTIRVAGVTVRHAFDLTRRPRVTTRGTAAPTTLRVRDLVVGHGTPASPHSTVTVRYIDVLYADGSLNDSSWPQPASFDLDSTLAGFARGIGGAGKIRPMQVGGRRLIVVPPALGFGKKQTGSIPPNSTLVFVVDLKAVRRA